ncbi:MAG: DoxX family protein, partial [Pseudomonadota bacterium]|nr:DoxX family protein [Pseudomonadota bacterium]
VAVSRAFERIPHSFVALLARLGIALTFWTSGQTKIEGLVLDPIGGSVSLGWPNMSEMAFELFRSEYALPVIPPDWAAYMTAVAEHVLPLLLVLGLASRLSALGLLIMTLVIQIFVYPLAYPTHMLWAAVLLYIMARGPGAFSLDHMLARRES